MIIRNNNVTHCVYPHVLQKLHLHQKKSLSYDANYDDNTDVIKVVNETSATTEEDDDIKII